MVNSIYFCCCDFCCCKGYGYVSFRLDFFSFICKCDIQSDDVFWIGSCYCCDHFSVSICQCFQVYFCTCWEYAFVCFNGCCDAIFCSREVECRSVYFCFAFTLCLRFAFCLHCHSCHIDSCLICQDSFYYIGTIFLCTCRDALVYQHAFYCVTVFDYYIKYDLTVFCICGRIHGCSIDHDMCVAIRCERDRILSHFRSIFIRFRCLSF